jgi:parallel beta-helix repeat protein
MLSALALLVLAAPQAPALVLDEPGAVVDLAGRPLRGAPESTRPDEYAGVGILITAADVTLRNARVSGYRVGILAQGANGLLLEGCDVSDNFRQRLGSTPEAEDSGDWLWPHANDGKEWRTNYGAGICIEDASGITVKGCRARDVQNGLILDRVTESKVFDNDFSFLSGWGIAMWRACDNTISRNALDFCVRGYSHGVYNRGQDSAGLLMFEQCSRNRVLENSITHGGDGVFAFAGKEALGEVAPLAADFDHARRGNNDNVFQGNDLSYAAAHGLELTFSFGNRITHNRMAENAICGVWGGYSRDTLIRDNELSGNGAGAYGLERGGVNIEHGARNHIVSNRFRGNRCGVRLWWDADEALSKTPWAAANGVASERNVIAGNRFDGDLLGIQLQQAGPVRLASNVMREVEQELDAPDDQPTFAGDEVPEQLTLGPFDVLGERSPVGARLALRGRDKIVMTEWGPYDWQRPLLSFGGVRGDAHVWRVLGVEGDVEVAVDGPVVHRRVPGADPLEIEVAGSIDQAACPYVLRVAADGARLVERATVVNAVWDVQVFPWTVDPREDAAAWRAQAEGAPRFRTRALDLRYGSGGPSQLADTSPAVAAAELPADRFGTLATLRLLVPEGRWRIVTTSDDGLRVRADGELVIDDWTWHAPKRIEALLDRAEAGWLELRVEHFELDGYAILDVRLEPAGD